MTRPVRRCLGIVALGRTPRPDLAAAFARHAGDAAVIVEGALDDTSAEEVADLAGRPGGYPLLVRLSDHASAHIDRDVLLPLIARRAASLTRRGASVVVVACAGDLPRFDHPGVLLLPGALLPGVVRAVSPTRHIGVVTPIADQAPAAHAKWTADGFQPRVTHASPYDRTGMVAAASHLNDSPCDVVLLDCMGHDDSYRDAFAAHCRHPVLLAQTVVARMAGEFVLATPPRHA